MSLLEVFQVCGTSAACLGAQWTALWVSMYVVVVVVAAAIAAFVVVYVHVCACMRERI